MRKGRHLWENRFSKQRLILAAVAAVVCVGGIIHGIHTGLGTWSTDPEAETEEETIAVIETIPEEELEEMRLQEQFDDITSEYGTLGIVSVDGYINVRKEPDSVDMTNIIGQLSDGAACDILEEDGEWAHVRSGGIEGWAASRYILTGEEAVAKGRESLAERVIIDEPVLNIRSAPEIDPANVVGKARQGERYVLIEEDGDWARIEADFSDTLDEAWLKINGDDGSVNAHVAMALDEARKLDLRQMALTQYDNIVLAYTDGYINVREEPKDDGIKNICGKFVKGCGGDLLDTVENDSGTWYKIKSGPVTGWVSAKYCLTGQSARDTALDYAVLTAFVNVDALNVRAEPSLDAKVWTSITKNQAYEVITQFDGWVEIDLDSEDADDKAFISTRDNNVEVRYGLPEAMEYYPAVEAANAAAAYRNSIVNYACQFIGNPYVWGGTSLTKGCDCSGFTQSVMAHFGISLPRVSRAQAKSGQKVTSDQMKPGDLVFYANKSGTINHVGIYIGNGQVVNAASRRAGIKIYRWNYRTPVAIRNVIGP